MLKLFSSNKFINYFTPVAGGLLGGLSIASYLWILLMPISLSILWSGFEKKYSNFLWGFTFILVSHYWLLHLHPLTWLGFSWFASLLISNIIWLFCSFLGGLLVTLWGLIGSSVVFKKYTFSLTDNKIYIRVILMSLIWAFGEQVLSQTSFLWIGVGESLIPGDIYIAGLARIIGSTGVCSLELLIGFWTFDVFTKCKSNLKFNRIFSSGILIIIFAHLIGAFLILPNTRNDNYPIAIWQTNIPTREKLFINNKQISDKILIEQERALSQNAQLLVAPEGTLKRDFTFQEPSKINTLIGGFREEKNNNIRNSLLAFKKGDISYTKFIDKYRLVPLGEWIPKIFNHIFLDLSSMGELYSGNHQRYLEWEKVPPLAVSICYEITDGLRIRSAINDGAKFILGIANLDPYPSTIFDQYLSLARMRSLENNIDVVIASNTGPSGLIRNDGRIEKLLDSKLEKNEVVYANLLSKKTLYTKYGLVPLILVFIIIIYILFIEEIK